MIYKAENVKVTINGVELEPFSDVEFNNIITEINMEYQKGYSLLRPFDLEAANFGTKAYWLETECVWFGPSGNKFSQPMYAVEHNAGMSYVSASELRAYPLAWVEGRPVYKGDVLYKIANEYQVECIVDGMPNGESEFIDLKDKEGRFIGTEYASNCRGYLTWQKPKTKREGWVNVYPGDEVTGCYSNKIAADMICSDDRIACIKIEWEQY